MGQYGPRVFDLNDFGKDRDRNFRRRFGAQAQAHRAVQASEFDVCHVKVLFQALFSRRLGAP